MASYKAYTIMIILVYITEMEELAKHGVTLPPNMQGLTEEQLVDLKLKDDWGEKCIPSGGWIEFKDPLTIRNGKGSV